MAKKKKGFSQLVNQQKALKKLERRVQQNFGEETFGGMKINPEGEVKMSEVLKAFVEPYVESGMTLPQRMKLLDIAVLAWNLSLLSEESRPSIIEQAIDQSFPKTENRVRREMREVIDELIERKQKLFAQYERYIVDFDVQETPQEFNLSVASTLIDRSAIPE
ncbi:MAG: hypothetical protein SWY16_11125 [Cyanobacteriota bacterium]|nr:hypothetical protein [Cyanobacteriota bacterium]